jgi:hypothetical protein
MNEGRREMRSEEEMMIGSGSRRGDDCKGMEEEIEKGDKGRGIWEVKEEKTRKKSIVYNL